MVSGIVKRDTEILHQSECRPAQLRGRIRFLEPVPEQLFHDRTGALGILAPEDIGDLERPQGGHDDFQTSAQPGVQKSVGALPVLLPRQAVDPFQDHRCVRNHDPFAVRRSHRHSPSLPLFLRRAATIFSVPRAGPLPRAARRRKVIFRRRMERSSFARASLTVRLRSPAGTSASSSRAISSRIMKFSFRADGDIGLSPKVG